MLSKKNFKLTGVFLILHISATSATPAAQPVEARKINNNIHARVLANPEQLHPRDPSCQQNPCLNNYACLDRIVENNDRSIRCVEFRNEESAVSDAIAKIGISSTKKGGKVPNTQALISVEIDIDMPRASASAVFMTLDGKYIIPRNVIVGDIRGKNIKLCTGLGDKSDVANLKARECYPAGTFDLKKGDFIDYTWGIPTGQEGRLVWGIFHK